MFCYVCDSVTYVRQSPGLFVAVGMIDQPENVSCLICKKREATYGILVLDRA